MQTQTDVDRNTGLPDAHALVVDDEPLPRAHLAHLLREMGVGSVEEAAGGADCLARCARSRIDWVFLDVRMPGMDGLAVADALGADARNRPQTPSVVFVTGFEDYALQAFDRAAADYLLKPVERARLAGTLQRLAARLPTPQGEHVPAAPDPLAPSALPPLPRLPIRTDYAIRLVNIPDIVAAVAREKRVEVLTAEAAYPTYYTLSSLEQRLPVEDFLRVHESWIVNLTQIVEVHSLGSQSYQLRLRQGAPLIPVSRRRLPLLQQRLGL